jgi:hypothetical protein
MTCSPKQSQFIKVDKVLKNEFGQYMVDEIHYHLDQSFSIRAFNSCKDLSHVEGKAMDLMCGSRDEKDDCDSTKWLDYLGKSGLNGGLFSHQINFKLSEKEIIEEPKHHSFIPLNVEAYKCNQFVDRLEGGVCSCKDCPASCNTQDEEDFVFSIKRSVKVNDKQTQTKVTHLDKREAGEKL